MKKSHKLIQKLAPFIPETVRAVIRKKVSLKEYDVAYMKALNPFIGMPEEYYPDSRYLLGIIEEVTQYHKHYIAACREMGISYKLLNIRDDSWIRTFRESECDAFLVWPSSSSTTYKEVYDYRLYILENDLKKRIYPTWRECWLTEHKPRLRDWMDTHNIPHPKTWVFHDRNEALNFADIAQLPIVAKTATGGSASGVSIVRKRDELVSIIRLAFGKGLRPRSYDPNDRQWGFIFLQEYFQDVEEWRMVRIGDSYFGYRKEMGASGLHSGSLTWSWLDPGPDLLNLLKHVTDIGGFTSMDVDVFRTKSGDLFVNECQTVFGCSHIQMKINDVDGRYVFTGGKWKFEPGNFCANYMCNLRIEYLCNVVLRKEVKVGSFECSGYKQLKNEQNI